MLLDQERIVCGIGNWIADEGIERRCPKPYSILLSALSARTPDGIAREYSSLLEGHKTVLAQFQVQMADDAKSKITDNAATTQIMEGLLTICETVDGFKKDMSLAKSALKKYSI